MKHIVFGIILLLVGGPSSADIVVPKKTIRANSIVEDTDIGVVAGSKPGAFDRLEDVIGQEARTTLYSGRPIFFEDVGPPAIVQRNQIVSLEFTSGGLIILTEGRSLERGGVGDRVRVMNLSSRSTLFGQIQQDGSVKVLR